MAIRINGQTGTIDTGGAAIVNSSTINGLTVPNETGSLVTTQRANSHIGGVNPTTLLQGDISLTNETTTTVFSSTKWTGSGVARNISTGVDMSTQWGNDSSKTNGGLVMIKSLNVAGNWYLFDTIRGVTNRLCTDQAIAQAGGAQMLQAFLSDGFTFGTDVAGNTLNTTYIAYSFGTRYRKSGTTNHGTSYTEHYDPVSGFGMIQWTGSGVPGIVLPNSVGRPISHCMWKNLNSTDSWVHEGNTLGLGKLIYMPGTAVLNEQGTLMEFNSNYTKLNVAASDTNAASNTYIMYYWCDAYVDKAGKLIGNYETGLYQGNGDNGSTRIIKTKQKPAFLLTRTLTYTSGTNDFTICDNVRNDGYRIFPHIPQSASDTLSSVTFYSDGFFPKGGNGANNLIGIKNFYLVVYDNDNGSGKSKAIKTQDTSIPSFNNVIAPVASGVDANGDIIKNVTINATTPGLTYYPGKNYPYVTKSGLVGISKEAPKYNTYDGFGDYYDSDTNKWYTNISLVADRGTSLGTWVGVNGTCNLSADGKRIRITNTQGSTNLGSASKQVTGLTIGKKYTIGLRAHLNGTSNIRLVIGSSPAGADILETPVGTIGGTFIASTTSCYIVVQETSVVVGQFAEFSDIYMYPFMDDGRPDLSNATEITDGRNYCRNIINADANGNIVYEEQLPDTVYLNSVAIQNLESIKGNAVTKSTTDNTIGKLLKVGDFGIGGPAVYRGPEYNLNDIRDTGFYYVNGSCGNNPLTRNGWLQVVNVFGNGMMQTYTSVAIQASEKNRVFVRNYVNATYWSPWQEQAGMSDGTWTPTIAGRTSAGIGTYQTQIGKWSKVGNWVTIDIYLIVTAHTGTGSMVVKGLPFIPANYTSCQIGYVDSLTYGQSMIIAYLEANGDYININAAASGTLMTNPAIDTSFTLMISCTYPITQVG